MLGPPKPRRLSEPVAGSLEELIPADHFYRHLEAKRDLGFVRDWARECYAERGRPGIDPVIFFKLRLIRFFEGIRSERKLIETARLHLAHRRYLGYALDEPLPNHSSLTRIRYRRGIGIFERFFEYVVDLCQEAGLIWGSELFFDATKVRADAAVESLVPRFCAEAKAHVTSLFPEDAAASGDPAPEVDCTTPDGLLRVPALETAPELPSEAVEEPLWDLLGERRLDPNRPSSGSYQRTVDFWVSTSDSDATPMRIGSGTALGYHDHYMVDGGKARTVVAALVTPADVMENAPMRDLLWRVRFRRKLRPHHVTGDTTYSTVENIVAIQDEGIRAYVPLADWDRKATYGPSRFAYDAERDEMRCPEGQPRTRLTAKHDVRVTVYRADPGTCNTCPVKAACTDSNRERTVQRLFDTDYLDRVRAYHGTEAYRKAMRKRQVRVETLFAEAKDWHGLRGFRLRGLDNVNVEGLVVAAGQNLKRLLAATGWGRHHAPCGSLVALPRDPPQLMATSN